MSVNPIRRSVALASALLMAAGAFAATGDVTDESYGPDKRTCLHPRDREYTIRVQIPAGSRGLLVLL